MLRIKSKMKNYIMMMAITGLCSCGGQFAADSEGLEAAGGNFQYTVDKFYDLEVLRYRVEGFDSLSLEQKKLIYYLSEAALEGRDILYDQNCKYNLAVRRTLEAIYINANDKETDEFKALEAYLKRVWFSNGIHHHYATDKFLPDFSVDYLKRCVNEIDDDKLPLEPFGGSKTQLLDVIVPVMFDADLLKKRVNQADGDDLIASSANNYYEGVSQAEVEAFYDAMRDSSDLTPVSYGLNCKLVKGEDGALREIVWKKDGMYSGAIERILFWLEKAEGVAENPQQKKVIASLIEYYKSGDLKQFDDYSILWVKDSVSRVDFVNGFIETYGDPLGLKASWESIVNFKNLEATKRTETISENAQWFEDNSPVDARFKKPVVKGVSAKVITAAMLGGDCFPPTPIGINLPNANWIRQQHGSKSVTIENITDAYDKAAKGNGFKEEFVWSDAERELMEAYGFVTGNIHTDLHECLGHGSGQLLPGVSQDALKAYGATIEEARADLFGLYYAADKKLVELGLLPNSEAYKAEYYSFMMNGLMTQLVRIELGNNVEEAHMRNRQLIAKWVYEKGKADNVVELAERDGKHFVKINDYEKLRGLFGSLLAEIQRIKSEGDFDAAKNIVEKYGVKVDLNLHKEVKARYEKLNLAPYKGFVNPAYKTVTDGDGNIVNVIVTYDESFTEQMLRYSKDYSNLPTVN